MTEVLLVVLIVIAAALCATGIWAMTRIAAAADSMRRLTDDLDATLMPLLGKADVTVDAFNAELLRIDMIVSRVEEVTERVSTTSHVVQNIVNAPVEKVNDVAERVRRAWKSRRSGSEAGEASTEQGETPAPPPADAGTFGTDGGEA